MIRTLEQNKVFHTLVSKLGIDAEQKRELVMEVSNGRRESSATLSYSEMQILINHLQELADARDDGAVRMRRKIFAVLHELGWETDKGKIDYRRFNKWLMKFGYLHKALMQYTAKELPTLVTQAENMLTKEYK